MQLKRIHSKSTKKINLRGHFTAMQHNSTGNESKAYFTRCLGTYYLLARPTGSTFSTYISVMVVLSIFSVLSTLGNGLVVYVYVKQKALQRANTLLLICLAFLDFVTAVVLEPLYVVRLLSEIFGFTSCVYILIVRRLLEYLRPVSFMTLALITIERYLALFKPITHRKMVTKRRLLHVVLLIWFVWFMIIFIRSFFPRITSAFYTFFTFVAFTLLAGNLIMYCKIGKLARLHSRPTRVSNAPGSLSAPYEKPTSRAPGTPGNENCRQAITYSRTNESVNYAMNAKRLNSATQSSEIAQTEKNTSHVKTVDTVSHVENREHGESLTRVENLTQAEKTHVPDEEDRQHVQILTHVENREHSESLTRVENLTQAEKTHVPDEDRQHVQILTHVEKTYVDILPNVIEETDHVENLMHVENTLVDTVQDIEDKDGVENLTHVQKTHVDTIEKTKHVDTIDKINNNHHELTQNCETTEKIEPSSTQFQDIQVTDSHTNAEASDKTNKCPNQIKNLVKLKNTVKLAVDTRERNATWTVFYIVLILAFSYVPISALLLYLSFRKEPDATSLFIYVPIADTLALVNALVNPFIYCYKNRKMRAAVKSVLQKARSDS